MERVLKESALSDQERVTIADYIAMTRKMSKLLSAYLKKLGNRSWIAQEVLEQLNRIVDLLNDGNLNAFFMPPGVTENEGAVT